MGAYRKRFLWEKRQNGRRKTLFDTGLVCVKFSCRPTEKNGLGVPPLAKPRIKGYQARKAWTWTSQLLTQSTAGSPLKVGQRFLSLLLWDGKFGVWEGWLPSCPFVLFQEIVHEQILTTMTIRWVFYKAELKQCARGLFHPITWTRQLRAFSFLPESNRPRWVCAADCDFRKR